MRKLNFKLLIAFFILLLTLIIPYETYASSSVNPETVFDYAELLTSNEEKELRKYAKEFEKYKISVLFLTTNDTQGKSSMNYSNDFYDTNNFRPDGVMFMIDMNNRNIYIDTVGKCIDYISGSDIDSALDRSYTYASEGNYYTCLKKMSASICTEIENHVNPFLGALRFSIFTFLIAVLIAVIVIVVLLVKHNATNKKTMAEHYIGSDFKVNDRNTVYMGCRHEVIHGYYEQKSSSGGGSGRHTSSGGISHGGGGRRF